MHIKVLPGVMLQMMSAVSDFHLLDMPLLYTPFRAP